mgnify:CR=1 FL=1
MINNENSGQIILYSTETQKEFVNVIFKTIEKSGKKGII